LSLQCNHTVAAHGHNTLGTQPGTPGHFRLNAFQHKRANQDILHQAVITFGWREDGKPITMSDVSAYGTDCVT
jgi:hypothetical protein